MTTEMQHEQPAERPDPPSRSGGGAGRVVGLVLGILAAIVGVVAFLGGLALIGLHLFERDDDGYYATETETLATDTRALAVDDLDFGGESGIDVGDLSATVRLEATSASPDPVFIGIASRTDADRYLNGAGHTVVTDFGLDGEPEYEEVNGTRALDPPAEEDIWVAQSQGDGTQRIEWEADAGRWAAVAMNADASPGLEIDAEAAIKVGWLHWVGIGLVLFGLVVASVAVFAITRVRRD